MFCHHVTCIDHIAAIAAPQKPELIVLPLNRDSARWAHWASRYILRAAHTATGKQFPDARAFLSMLRDVKALVRRRAFTPAGPGGSDVGVSLGDASAMWSREVGRALSLIVCKYVFLRFTRVQFEIALFACRPDSDLDGESQKYVGWPCQRLLVRKGCTSCT